MNRSLWLHKEQSPRCLWHPPGVTGPPQRSLQLKSQLLRCFSAYSEITMVPYNCRILYILQNTSMPIILSNHNNYSLRSREGRFFSLFSRWEKRDKVTQTQTQVCWLIIQCSGAVLYHRTHVQTKRKTLALIWLLLFMSQWKSSDMTLDWATIKGLCRVWKRIKKTTHCLWNTWLGGWVRQAYN